jgi:hypothetical protein
MVTVEKAFPEAARSPKLLAGGGNLIERINFSMVQVPFSENIHLYSEQCNELLSVLPG